METWGAKITKTATEMPRDNFLFKCQFKCVTYMHKAQQCMPGTAYKNIQDIKKEARKEVIKKQD